MQSLSKCFFSSKELEHSWIMGIWMGPTADIFGRMNDWLHTSILPSTEKELEPQDFTSVF